MYKETIFLNWFPIVILKDDDFSIDINNIIIKTIENDENIQKMTNEQIMSTSYLTQIHDYENIKTCMKNTIEEKYFNIKI